MITYTDKAEWLGSPANIKGANKDAKISVGRSMAVQNLLFCVHTLCTSYVTNTFLLVSSSVRSNQLLCFVQGQGQKSEQKPTTKNFVGFHNHSPLLTMIQQFFCQMVSVEQILVVIKNNYFFNTQCYSHVVSNCTILCYCTMLNFF